MAKAKLRHGERYDYSRVEYRGQQHKVTIGCPEHGDFVQNAASHTNQGNGCPKCADKGVGDKKRLSVEVFIEKSREIHGERYDYSRVQYQTAKTRVTIGCRSCGSWFTQSPDKHTNAGRGCPDCGARHASTQRRMSTEQFIQKAKKIHGGKADYAKSEYLTRADDVQVFCNACKVQFRTNAGNHLNGQFGCPSCRYLRSGDSQRKSLSEWLEDAKSVHENNYDYSEVDYLGNKKKVTITCRKCGLRFMQEAKSHILGQGCPVCRYESVAEKKTIPVETILERCKEIHDNRWTYNWGPGDYKNTRNPMPITCEDHGVFYQTMTKHLAGQGCPSCATVGFDPSKPGYYYVHEILNLAGDVVYYKGGISGDWERRLAELKSGLPNSLSIENVAVVYFEDGKDAREIESTILRIAKELNVKAPPRSFDGGHELFLLSPLEFALEQFS